MMMAIPTMLQHEPSCDHHHHDPHHDTLNRSSDDVLTMEGTNDIKQQKQHEHPDCSEELSHLTLSDSTKTASNKTRPEESMPKTNNLDSCVTNQSHSVTNRRNMKLIVRSQYWGRTLKGKTCRTQASMNRPFRTISCQAVLYNTDEYWGCCPHHGKRVLELSECHFQDSMPEQDWDLYAVQSWVSPTHSINDFFLLPQKQTVIDVSRNIILSGWTFVGSCTANRIRDDLDGMLRPWLEENDNYGYRFHHVHIEIMMDKAFDRETPRSRKVSNEKTRQERQQNNSGSSMPPQESSERTDDTTSSERDGPPSIAGTGNPFVPRSHGGGGARGGTPPIPHVISNDSSSVFSHSVTSSAMMTFHDPTAWGGPADSYWGPAPSGLPPTSHPTTSPHPGMQWLPGSALPMTPTTMATGLTSLPPHLSWQTSMPPPMPQLQAGMTSPHIPHHHLQHGAHMTELQQYLMYSDSLAAAAGHPQYHNHHGHYYPNTTTAAHTTTSNSYALDGSIPREYHVPHEIMSGPTVTSGVHTPMTTNTTSVMTPSCAANTNGSCNHDNTTDTGTTTSVSTVGGDSVGGVDAVVTTVTSNNMVSSTCWSPSSGKNNSNNGDNPVADAGSPPQQSD